MTCGRRGLSPVVTARRIRVQVQQSGTDDAASRQTSNIAGSGLRSNRTLRCPPIAAGLQIAATPQDTESFDTSVPVPVLPSALQPNALPVRQHGTGCVRERSLSRTCPANILRAVRVIIMTFNRYLMLAMSSLLFAGPVSAQTSEDPAVTACKSTALVALQGQSSEITGLVFDAESLAVSAADTKVEDVAVKTVILGEAYIERKGVAGKADRFVCLIGEKGKVLLTFFTAK